MPSEFPADPSGLAALIHTALRAWHQPNPAHTIIAPFQTLVCYRERAHQTWEAYPDPVEIIRDVLRDCLAEMSASAAWAAELLVSRFINRETILHAAHRLNLSPDQINRRQREALLALAQTLWVKEGRLRRAAQLRLGLNLPPPEYAGFVGRKALRTRLTGALLDAQGSWIVTLVGLGGVGKTALAVSVVRELLNRHPFLDVIWIRADAKGGQSPATRSQRQWQHVERAFVSQLFPGLPLRSGFRPYARLLKTFPYLVFLDNFETFLDQAELVERFLALSNPSKFLLTSRVRPPAQSLVYEIRMPELSRQDTARLLVGEVSSRGVPKGVEELRRHTSKIIALTGGNPLALKVVIGWLGTLPLPIVLRSLQRDLPGDIEEMYRYIYQSAWAALSPNARRLLQAMTHAPEEGVRFTDLEALSRLSGSSLAAAVQALVDYSLMEMQGTLKNPKYRIPTLTRTFLKTGLPRRF